MLNLPKKKDGKPYLSYSQIALWKKDKNHRRYIREYFFGEPNTNKALKAYGAFGNKVGEALEKNDFSGFTDKEQELLKTVPRYDEFEKEIWLEMDGFWVKGYIDTNTKDGKKLLDYKTGEIEKRRGEYESDNYIQTEIYSAAIKQSMGVIPEEVSVVIIQREGNAFSGEELTLGDHFETIVKKVDEDRIKEVLEEVQQIAEEISLYYTTFQELNQ